MGERVYLDHNATSPLRPEAEAAVVEALRAPAGNPSSIHAEGRAARARIERARGEVAALLGAAARDLVFTSGGSEAIATAIRGACERAPTERRRIVASALEHSAVLEAARGMARHGFAVEEVPCEATGRVDADAFARRLGRDVALAALQAANPETGVVQPVREVAARCREAGAPLLVDAVQAAGKLAPGIWAGADFVAVSAHKLGGPQGAGALALGPGAPFAPLILGGAQETRRRGGTEAVALLAGFGAAAAAAARDLGTEARRLEALRIRIETRIREEFPGGVIHGGGAPRLPNTVAFSLPGVSGEALVIALDVEGFALSTGSACASGAVEPSHVLKAMGLSEAERRGGVRLSMGWSTREDEVRRFLAALRGVAARVRASLGA